MEVLQLDRTIKSGDVPNIEKVLDKGASPDGDKNAGKKPIHFAVETGLAQITALLCERGANPNVANPEDHGRSPLHMAVVRGFTSVVKYLLERNADPNLVDNAGETPLITAVQKNEMSSVSLLLKFGADVHTRDANHNTALLIALEKNHAETVQMLLKEGASVMNITLTGDSTIHVAARKCSTWILEMLREKGCDIEKSNRVGSLPLHLAAESGNLEAVKWFLLNGAKHDERDAAGKTAADRAADARQKHVVDWLNDLKTPRRNQRAEIKTNVERERQAHVGSNIGFESFASSPSVQTQDGQRSGTKGGRVEHSTLGDLAKVHGESNADQRDAERKILEASREGSVETVKNLLQKKVDLEVTDRKGRRPLHLAALGGHDGVARELLRGGADASAETPEGFCCVHYAALGGHISTLMLLLEFRCDIQALTKDGSTALHLAAAHGHSLAVEWLVTQAGLRVDSANKKHETALDLARKAGHKATVQSLLQVQISLILTGGDVGTLSQLVEEFDLDVLCAKENDKGFRSVHYAACGGNVEALKILQNKKYDMNSVTSQGYSALHYAVKYSHLAAVKWLVKKAGLDAALPGRGVASALELARRKRSEEIVTYLERVTTVKALESGDLEALRDLVREGVDVEAVCERKFGIRVAHCAAKLGHLTLLKNLREIKCDVKGEADAGLTALHYAANYGQLEAVKWLVEEAGLDVFRRSKDGLTALDYAEKCNHVDIIAYLRQITKGEGGAEEPGRVGGGGRGGEGGRGGGGGKALSATGGGSSMELRSAKTIKLLGVAQSGDAEAVRRLAEGGVDLEAVSALPGLTGLRALHLASIEGHARTVQELVRGGADVNARSAEGACAIHYAAIGGHTEIIGILTAAKCDPNAVTSDGDSALHLAVHSSNLSTVRCLIRSGVDFARGNRGGLTPLDIAVAVQKADIASHLVEVSVERALESEDTGILVRLLQEGAKLDHLIVQRSSEGMRAVHYAARHGSLEMLALLKERNVDMTSTTVEGHTALHWAALGGQTDAARWLVEHGGLDAACRSKSGATALDVALKANKAEVADFLRRITRVGGLGNNRRQPHEGEAGAAAEAAGGGGVGAVGRKGVGETTGRGEARAMAQGLKETDKITRVGGLGSNGNADQPRETVVIIEQGVEAVEAEAGGRGVGVGAAERKGAEATTGRGEARDKETRGAGDAGAAPRNPPPHARRAAQEPGRARGTPELDAKLLKAASDGDLKGVKMWLDEGADIEAASSAKGEEKGLRPLHLAAWAGHAGVVRELLRRGADIRARGRDGYSAIHYAARGGFDEVLKILHENKCNMRAKTDSGQTLLHVAADNGNLKATEWIVEHTNVDLEVKNNDGKTALEVAHIAKQKAIVNYLMKTPAQEAIQKGDLSKVRELVAGGFDANAVFQEKKNKECRPLHLAAEGGHADIVKFLLRSGAQAEAENYEGMTPLHLASWGGHAEVIKVLLGGGAKGDARTKEGMTAVHLASMGGHVSSMEALTPTCDILSVTRERKSALHLAAEYGNLDAVEWLHLQGLDSSLKDHSGQTPLQYAKDEGHKKVVEFLKRHDQQTLNRNGIELHSAVAEGNLGEVRRIIGLGANLSLPSIVEGEDGRQALHTAALLGYTDILLELLRRGADRNGTDSRGNTVVHYATLHEDTRLLDTLHLEHVDVASAVNFSGETPLHIAASRGNVKVLEWLLRKGVKVNHKNSVGMTAEEVAASKRQYGAAEILSKNVVKIDKAEGLKSLGNTCYMNTILQCLFYIKEVTAFFKTDRYKQELVGPRLQANVTESFAAVVKALTYGRNYVGALQDFKSAMCGYDPLFLGNDQRDAHDFLSAFLFAAMKEFKNQDNSSFKDLFFGKEQAVIKCVKCKREVLQKDEIFSILTLTVTPDQHRTQLESLIASAYDEQRIKWDCNKCNSTFCTRKVSIEVLPKILIIHFNRYSPNSKSVHKTPVYYPLKVTNMKNYMVKASRSDAPNYQLRSVACHRGSMTGGHYTAICSNEDRWSRFSDEQVVPVQSPQSQEAHILFYEAEAGRSFLPKWLH